jgi:hypothetical protein
MSVFSIPTRKINNFYNKCKEYNCTVKYLMTNNLKELQKVQARSNNYNKP